MGDVIMTSPAIRAVKDAVPERKVTLLTSIAGSIITPFIPSIDETIIFDVPWIKTEEKKNGQKCKELIDFLRTKDFDAAIIFTSFSQNPLPAALVAFLADIPLRLAYCHEKPYDLVTDWIPDPEPKGYIRHEVERQLALVATIGAQTQNTSLHVSLPPDAKQNARIKLVESGVALDIPWVIIHPGVSSLKRQYSPRGFAEVARHLHKKGYQILFTGISSEKNLIQDIQKLAQIPSTNLAGLLSIDELMGLLSLSPLLIANNTGPVHIAAALKTPVIDLYALTNPQHTPWKTNSHVLYFPVSKNLLDSSGCNQIPSESERLTGPDMIVEKAEKLLTEHYTKRTQTI